MCKGFLDQTILADTLDYIGTVSVAVIMTDLTDLIYFHEFLCILRHPDHWTQISSAFVKSIQRTDHSHVMLFRQLHPQLNSKLTQKFKCPPLHPLLMTWTRLKTTFTPFRSSSLIFHLPRTTTFSNRQSGAQHGVRRIGS